MCVCVRERCFYYLYVKTGHIPLLRLCCGVIINNIGFLICHVVIWCNWSIYLMERCFFFFCFFQVVEQQQQKKWTWFKTRTFPDIYRRFTFNVTLYFIHLYRQQSILCKPIIIIITMNKIRHSIDLLHRLFFLFFSTFVWFLVYAV